MSCNGGCSVPTNNTTTQNRYATEATQGGSPTRIEQYIGTGKNQFQLSDTVTPQNNSTNNSNNQNSISMQTKLDAFKAWVSENKVAAGAMAIGIVILVAVVYTMFKKKG